VFIRRRLGLKAERLVVIDGTCATTSTTRQLGRCVYGLFLDRLHGGHWKTPTPAAGILTNFITASYVLDGTPNGEDLGLSQPKLGAGKYLSCWLPWTLQQN
jgi:hypothetical protein